MWDLTWRTRENLLEAGGVGCLVLSIVAALLSLSMRFAIFAALTDLTISFRIDSKIGSTEAAHASLWGWGEAPELAARGRCPSGDVRGRESRCSGQQI